MAAKKIAFSYIRMSTKDQLTGDSRRRQVENSKKYAEKRGYVFKDTIEDIGVSGYEGKNLKGGELGKFIQAAKDGELPTDNIVLLIESFDRFSRDDPFAAVSELVKFIDTGVTVETTIDGQQYNRKSMGKHQHLLYTAVGVLFRAHEESATKSDRLKEAWAEKRKNISDKKLTSKVPAWLHLNKKTGEIEKVEEAVRIVEEIFRLTIEEDMGAISITRLFNSDLSQYPKFTKSKTRSWQESYIKKILNNKAVYGAFQPHKMIGGKRMEVDAPIADYFPAVIDKDRFDLAQSKIKERAKSGTGRKGDKMSNIFTRMVTCGNCGGTVRYVDKGKGPKGERYLICANSYNKNGCDSPSWRYDQFESEFIKEVVELPLDELMKADNDPHVRKKLIDSIAVIKTNIDDLENDHDETRLLMREARKSKNSRRQKLYSEDLLSIESKLDALESELNEKERELAALQSRLKRRTQEELIEYYNLSKATDDEKKQIALRRKMYSLIRSVTDRIVIDNNFNKIPPWETLDANLPKSLFDELKKRGYKTESQIEAYFDTPYGRRIFNEALREIRIYFKGGGARVCRPAKNRSYKLVERVKRFVDNDKKRTAEQNLKKKRAYKKDSAIQLKLGKEIYDELNSFDDLEEGAIEEYIESLGERERDALNYYQSTLED